MSDTTVDLAEPLSGEVGEALHSGLLEALGQGAFVLDLRGRCLRVTRRLSALLGRPGDELEGRMLEELLPGKPEHHRTALERAQEGERLEYEEREGEGPQARAWCFELTPLRDGAGRIGGALGLCREVTAERRREDELRQARRLSALDRSAVGLTHDLRNLLTVLCGHLDLLSDGPLDGKTSDLATVRLAADRALELARQFLTRARTDFAPGEPLDVNGVLAETAALLKPRLGPAVRLEVRPHTPLPRVAVEARPMSRLLLNLGLNAAAAMPGGGRLQLETDDVRLSPEDVVGHAGRRVGRFVCLRVSDTGPGLPTTHREQLFQPFQSRRRDGDGFGLGLAVVASLVEQHHGWLEYESAPGLGTCFHVYLPAVE
jgi:PAS domain S-box-containing protein